MTIAATKLAACCKALSKRKRVRFLLNERQRLSVVRAGIESYYEGYLADAWTERTRAKLEEQGEFSSVWIMLIVQFVLPILLQWIIDNWSQE